ncbi:MAG: hypothetical protein LUE20_11050 [Oscillospiraceae bacterium]|nr:hypothetical protein [Oscillospiraceae bacterium]
MAEMETTNAGLAEESIVGEMAEASDGIASAAVPEGAGLVSNTQTLLGSSGPAAGSEPYTLEMNDEDLPLLKQQLESFTGTCRELGLSKSQAEQVLAWQKDRLREAETETQRNTEMVIQEWNTEIRNDSEFGGIRYTRTIADARAALATFDPDGSLRQLLKDTYGEYHPDIIRFAARVGRAISEHKFVEGNAGPEPKQTPLAERFYGRDGSTVMHGI